ncbi:hypothetical protein AAZX31_05G213400 [Glycine max]|uniref:CRS2-associated factor 1, chloroplastic n=1 Tax=Glycine soja TaxID=3848 RepID=A0A0B2SBH9_GLYSO|nr:CRS2-associated factor 1, chloroplastic-like [Glycine soja]KAG5155780.1 hypothetical protein JHK82_013749 [Glycine max]KAH1251707.1 CRS2-associated factor 1, chloroplastic [Glycine max]KHN41659.1 CRS2-associated factor 1, chloroplastic [Glycine soja]RZC13863.1 CRS2-associated factor 1, chloroplastic [Glycine soja]
MKAIYYMTLAFPLFQVKVEVSYPNENSHQSMYGVTEVPSLTKLYEVETTNNSTNSYADPEPRTSLSPSMTIPHYNSHAESPSKAMSESHGTEHIMDSRNCSDGLSASISGSHATLDGSDNSTDGMVDSHSDKLLDALGDVSPPPRSVAPSMKAILLLLEQAVEKGSALVLDKDSLDADNIYQNTVAFAKSASSGPVFRKNRKAEAQKSHKQEGSTLETEETTTVPMKRKKENSTKIPRQANFDDQLLNVVPQGTLGVDELAKLLT